MRPTTEKTPATAPVFWKKLLPPSAPIVDVGDTAGGLFEVTVRKEVTTAGSFVTGVEGVVMDDEVSSGGAVGGVDDVEGSVVELDVSSGSPELDGVAEEEDGVGVEEEGVTEGEEDELGGGGMLEELGTELEESPEGRVSVDSDISLQISL